MPKHEVELPEIPGYKFRRIGIPGSPEEYTLSYVRGVPTVTQTDKYSSYVDQRVIYEKKEPLKIGFDVNNFYPIAMLMEYKPKKVLLVQSTNMGKTHNLAYLHENDHYRYVAKSLQSSVNLPYWYGFYVIEN
jgi:hypothetical protein